MVQIHYMFKLFSVIIVILNTFEMFDHFSDISINVDKKIYLYSQKKLENQFHRNM